jgi:hypothetical protein
MKQVIYMIMLALCSCQGNTEQAIKPMATTPIVPTPPIQQPVAVPADTLQPISEKEIRKEFKKSRSVHAYHCLKKKDFSFDNWLIKTNDQKIVAQIDSIRLLPSINNVTHKAAMPGDWTLTYHLSKGWFEEGRDRTNVNDYYHGETNRFKLSMLDLKKIFKGWGFHIKSNNMLVVAYWNFYPNGNQTSWNYEKMYIFKKTKL